jgi:hypothetical protein
MRSKIKKQLSLSVAVGLLCWLSAGAALVEMDYLTSGDKQITRDTVNNIDWLDFDVAVNYSVNDILGGAGGFLADGWTVATEAQADALYASAGIMGDTWDANAIALRDLLGVNTFVDNSAIGILDTGMGLLLWEGYVGPTYGNSFGTTYKDPGVGIALVKAIPEPATASILFGGAAVLGLFRRLSRRYL